MNVERKDILKMLDEEVDWCLKHPAKNLSKEFQLGFMAGLKQAILLIDTYREEE